MAVSLMGVSCDLEETGRRRAELEKYLGANILNGDRFICRHFQQCRSSHDGPFAEGQLHHVGRYYDLTLDHLPMRVMVVGQEIAAADRRMSMDVRYHQVMKSALKHRFKKDSGYTARNPHMKGTTSVLRLVFGVPLGVDYSRWETHSIGVAYGGKTVVEAAEEEPLLPGKQGDWPGSRLG